MLQFVGLEESDTTQRLNTTTEVTSALLSNNKYGQWVDKSINQVVIEDPLRVWRGSKHFRARGRLSMAGLLASKPTVLLVSTVPPTAVDSPCLPSIYLFESLSYTLISVSTCHSPIQRTSTPKKNDLIPGLCPESTRWTRITVMPESKEACPE